MANESMQREQEQAQELQEQATRSQSMVVGEFVNFLWHSKKWWLTPIIVVLLLIGVLLLMGRSGAAPFIYTLF